MKIKITLIAFFASALILTSCMKNEVSPGIESVRTAYAALLNAKAQAEIITANANATLTNAQAAYQNALAAMKLAEAQGELANAEAIRAELAANIKVWALELQDQTRLYNIAMDAYNKAVRDAKNASVTEYFLKYSAALDTVRAIQAEIFAKNAQILALAIDVAAGTTNSMPGLVATLAAKNAGLATLQAQLTAAKALLGTPDALVTAQTGLKNDTTTLQAAINKLLIDQQVLFPDWQVAYKADTTAKGVTSRALATANAAKAAYSAAATSFATTWVDPTFWTDAIAKVVLDSTRLDSVKNNAVASYTDYQNDSTLIASGTTVETATWTLKNDSVTAYVAAIAALRLDSVTKYATYKTDSLLYKAAVRDTVVADSLQSVLVANMADWYFVWKNLTPSSVATADSTLYKAGQTDSTNYVNILAPLARNITLPARAATVTASRTLFLASLATWNTTGAAKIAFLGVSTDATNTTLYGRRKIALLAITAKQAAIASATYTLPDKKSEYLHWRSFIPAYEVNLAASLAAKEVLRPKYETYKNEFYASYVAGLLATYTTANQTYLDKKVLSDATGTALTTAKTPYDNVGLAKDAKVAEKAVKDALLAVYANAIAYNTDIVASINGLITTKLGEIATAQAAIDAAVIAYKAGKVNYDQFQIELTSLNTELTAANANVTFWKKLLDAAIAAG